MKKILCLIVFIIMTNAHSQELSSHQWEDRIILLLTDSHSNETFQKQISELQNNASGLIDRQLIVYQMLPEKYTKGLSNIDWKNDRNLYKTYKKTNSKFEFVLIGLDGSVKVQQSDFLACEKLFSIIDAMPMRRSEIRKKY